MLNGGSGLAAFRRGEEAQQFPRIRRLLLGVLEVAGPRIGRGSIPAVSPKASALAARSSAMQRSRMWREWEKRPWRDRCLSPDDSRGRKA